MFCAKCGSHIDESNNFCLKCGASKSSSSNVSIDNSSLPFDILEFVRKAFRIWFSILLWLVLIGITIFCSYFGSVQLGSSWGAVFGFIIGVFVGAVTVILGGGLITTIVEIGENMRTIRDHLEKRM